jgi:hypothetical protein
LGVKLYEPVSSECLKVAPRCAGKRAGRRSLIIATEALASSDNERGPEARVRNKYEFSRRMSRASMEEDQRQADRIDLKVMARTHASAALKPRQLSPSGQAEHLPGHRHRYHKYCSSCVNDPAGSQRR